MLSPIKLKVLPINCLNPISLCGCIKLWQRMADRAKKIVLQVNLLTTDDNYSCRQNSTTCYQLVQSVLNIGSVLTERVG